VVEVYSLIVLELVWIVLRSNIASCLF